MKWRVFTLVTLERVWTLLTGWTCSERSGWSLSLRWTRPELSLMRLCRFLQVSANYWHFMTHFCRKVQHTARLETEKQKAGLFVRLQQICVSLLSRRVYPHSLITEEVKWCSCHGNNRTERCCSDEQCGPASCWAEEVLTTFTEHR